jgi:hypothetical protein|tara:strand:- start:385 stop:543 length:159 start_codon:yes stop_codon:yes gene_type:complete
MIGDMQLTTVLFSPVIKKEKKKNNKRKTKTRIKKTNVPQDASLAYWPQSILA